MLDFRWVVRLKTVARRSYLTMFLLGMSLTWQSAGIVYSQDTRQPITSQSTQAGPNTLPSFEAVSIRPIPPGTEAHGWGFHSLPGGRVDIGAIGIRQLISQAFDVPADRIKGGPQWLDTEGYAILAVPPDASRSRTAPQAHTSFTPTAEQRLMLQSMLMDRFSLRYHEETRPGSVYMLTRGRGKLRLDHPKDSGRQPAFVLFMRGDIFDGETRGANVSMPIVAGRLGADLNASVVDETGLTGSYDFYVEPFAPENNDARFAAIGAMHRLGLNLKRASDSVKVIVIDNVERPTPN